MKPIFLFVAIVILGLAWTAIWAWVMWNAHRPLPSGIAESQAAGLRRGLVPISILAVAAVFIVSLYWLPYAFVRVHVLGRPTARVQVNSEQWDWTLTPDTVPAHVPVEFDVTSRDVNHGFGLYGPHDGIVAQVQAMPGYTNRLILDFDEPGTYTVRCLELCGAGHYLMQSSLTVTP